MRLHPHTVGIDVTRGPDRRRPILLMFAGLAVTMSSTEARTLADQLVDATEQT
ncbi:hypothetical protein L1080_023340 [Rhodococcus sp. MSC1_016]|jgi:hypothetical protein|uniref:hypothetical protein n=1 Tax=Rhodococcus sp. MSC1_016 TaxID=2909266 RepID=UPI002030331B|nr:hypothetical protein [Rhodococcus sp. MSC1_016]